MTMVLNPYIYDYVYYSTTQPNVQLIETECGPVNNVTHLLSWQRDFEILRIDIAPKIVEYSNSPILFTTFQRLDYCQINKVNQKIDGTISSFFTPYFSHFEGKHLISCKFLFNNRSTYTSYLKDVPDISDNKVNRQGLLYFQLLKS